MKAEAETRGMWHEPLAAWGHQELEGSARSLPWSLQGVHSPADSLIPGFWPPEL